MENNNQPNKISKVVIILSVIIAAISLYILLTTDLSKKPLAGQGNTIQNETDIGGEFELTDQNGNKFSSVMMKGKLSLVYFGFTFCPDICPTSLQKLTNVLQTLEKYHIDVLPIFITIDPTRDSAEVLKAYVTHFHPKIIGLTGGEDQIAKVSKLYKVYFAKAGDNKDSKNYMMDHSSFVYLMGKDGKYIKHFYMSTTPEEMVEAIRINNK